VRYWTEATLCRFLEIPDVLGAGPVIFQMATYLGVFPCSSLAPTPMNMEAMLTTITLMTERHKKIFRKAEKDRLKVLYASLAVFDKRAGAVLSDEEALEDTLKGVQGFAIDKAKDDRIEEEEDDSMTLAALGEIDAIGALGLADQPNIVSSIVPADNLLRLVELLLLIAPLNSQESAASQSDYLTDKNVEVLREVANTILAAFGIEERPCITYKAFHAVVPNSLPHLFQGFHALFEHFLFQKDMNLSKFKDGSLPEQEKPVVASKPETPLLPETGQILNRATLCQLSFFITPSSLFRKLHLLYSGDNGFSMMSLEKHVFTWRAPTILLVTGHLLPTDPTNSSQRSFVDSLPPKRYTDSIANGVGQRVTYGVYLTTPWKHTHKAHFGDASTMLFQLSPIHDVFRASSVNHEYSSYTTPSGASPNAGINFGSPLPIAAGSKASAHGGTSSKHVALGPVSLYLDASLEFGVFTHTAAGGGSFYPSVSPARTRPPKPRTTPSPMPADPYSTAASGPAARRRSRGNSLVSPVLPSPTSTTSRDRRVSSSATATSITNMLSGDGQNWQDRFEIEALEVWGCGGDEEEARRRKRIEDEERESRLRREAVAKTGDVDADREILYMAGLIGHGREGGSMG